MWELGQLVPAEVTHFQLVKLWEQACLDAGELIRGQVQHFKVQHIQGLQAGSQPCVSSAVQLDGWQVEDGLEEMTHEHEPV